MHFDRPELKPGERLVVIFCVDDGAVIYLNGQSWGVNMPDGPLTANTLASRALADSDEGFYLRMPGDEHFVQAECAGRGSSPMLRREQ